MASGGHEYEEIATLRKNANGKFGISFNAYKEGVYWITTAPEQHLKGCILLSINGRRTGLEEYCLTAEALAMDQWKIGFRPTLPHGQGSMLSMDDYQGASGSLATDSLQFSLISGGDGTNSLSQSFGNLSMSQDIAEMSLMSPVSVVWSDAMEVKYPQGSHIITESLKFKKKETKDSPKKQWIILKDIEHTEAAGSDRLVRGDWVLKLDDEVVPIFVPPYGTTHWFCERLKQSAEHPVTITVRKPFAVVPEARERLDSIVSVFNTATQAPSTSAHTSVSRTAPVAASRAPPVQLHSTSTSNSSYDTNGPESLTENPDFIRKGQQFLKNTRSSVQIKPVEKLGRCRLIFHHISPYDAEITDELQCQIFGQVARDAKFYGNFTKEYHIHVAFSADGGIFSAPTESDCYSSSNQGCSFEMHETLVGIFEKTAVDSSRKEYLMTLPNHISSGPLSIGSIKRLSVVEEFHTSKMHLEVLSLTGSLANACTTWCSPLIYCRHSVNIVVIDGRIFFDERSGLEILLSRTLSDINTHSRDFSLNADDSVVAGGKVLLLVTNSMHLQPLQLKEAIQLKLRPHLSRLIYTDDKYPYALLSKPAQIQSLLIRELKSLSANALNTGQNYIYPHMSVMASQELSNGNFCIIDRSELKERLIASVDESQRQHIEYMLDGTMRYLRNTGIAYIPDLSYSKSVGRGCPNISFSLFIRVHRLVSVIDELLRLARNHATDRGVASEASFNRMITWRASEKIISILKELHIFIPAHNRQMDILFPLYTLNFQRGEPPPPPAKMPDLLLSYKGNLNFLLVTAFLNELSKASESCNVDYHYRRGVFHIYDCGLLIVCTTGTFWGSRYTKPVVVTDQSLSFFITSMSSEKTTTKVFTKSLIDFINAFHRLLKTKPTFGPPCPLDMEECVNAPFHVINILEPMLGVPTCSGRSLEHSDSVTDYLCDGSHANTPTRIARRDSILNRHASEIPQNVLDQLNEHNQIQRNWRGLAVEHNFTGGDIEWLSKQENPTYHLLEMLSAHQGYTIRNLILDLNTMERMDVMRSINNWIDYEIRSGRA